MHKNATKCNETLSKWCKNKHGASKIVDTLETYHLCSAIEPSTKHMDRQKWLVDFVSVCWFGTAVPIAEDA
jgi:hypothetical protein